MTHNILIVDDVSSNRKIVRKILQRVLPQCTFLEAEDGLEAIKIIESNRISIMILDVIMPGMDGIEVLTQIKSDNIHKETQVIIYSALEEMETVQKALQLGALDYFTKPLTQEEINITLPLKIKNALAFYNQKCELLEYYEKTKIELQLARKVQKTLVDENIKTSFAQMSGAYIPIEEIGGDMFIFKELNGITWFMIADVSGHGISSAIISSMVNVVFNASIAQCNTPNEVLKKLNDTLIGVFAGAKSGLVSAFVGSISNGILSYSNAGHPYPILMKSSDNTVIEFVINGFLLGMFENIEYEEKQVEIMTNDIIVLFTDGLFDKGGENNYVDWEVVINYCKHIQPTFKEDIKKMVSDLVKHFEGNSHSKFIDDVAVMAIKIN